VRIARFALFAEGLATLGKGASPADEPEGP
jgi:hypothetical protein